MNPITDFSYTMYMPVCLDSQNENIGMIANGFAVDSHYKYKSKSRGSRAFQMLLLMQINFFGLFMTIYQSIML